MWKYAIDDCLYEGRNLADGGPDMLAPCEDIKVTTSADHLPHWVRTVLGQTGTETD